MYIYKITNKINGKVYIGQTIKSIEERWKQHCSKNSLCKALQSALIKYGMDNFSIECVEECYSIDQLNIREIFWINFYNSFYEGYNLTSGGNNFLRSDITKQKMRKPKTKLHKLNISKGRTGIKTKGLSQSTREKMSKNRIGPKNPQFGKQGPGAKPILCVNNGVIYNSIRHAAKELNLIYQSVSEVAHKRQSHTKNYIFEFIEAIDG